MLNAPMHPRLHLSLVFGDVLLPIIPCADGHPRVPLKPIALHVGVNWKTFHRRLAPGGYLHRRLGVQIIHAGEAKSDQAIPLKGDKPGQLCIRLDRVAAFLNSLNPEKIRVTGNVAAADWLEAKHAEWDDALHAYETAGIAAKGAQQADALLRVIARIDRIRNAELRRLAAAHANRAFGLSLSLGCQRPLPLEENAAHA